MKERITITLDSELIRQIDKRIDGNIIKNRTFIAIFMNFFLEHFKSSKCKFYFLLHISYNVANTI